MRKKTYFLKKFVFSLCMSLVFTVTLFAQDKTITGQVVDNTNLGLPGVSILVKGTTNGTITDFDGNYSLNNVPSGSTLVFSFVGFTTQEVVVGDQTTINISLSEDAAALDEVVVIGYGTTTRKDATGSVSSVTADDFNEGMVAAPDQLLTGKLAGVQITTSGGAPGAKATIRIRGGSSLSASNDPLIVIDGVPLDNGVEIAGSSNPLNFINPNDIQSMSLLKDASATAIYGARASNGVILITTKKGREGAGWRFSYNSSVATSTRTKLVDVLNAEQFKTAMENNGTPNGQTLIGSFDTDWQDLIYRTAFSYDNNFSATGVLLGIPVRVSLGYLDQDGILRTDNLKKTSASIGINPSLFDDHLKINVNVLGAIQNSFFANTGAIGSAVSMDPTKPVFVDSENFGGYYEWLNSNGDPEPFATRNPIALLDLRKNDAKNKRSVGSIKFDYKFHFLPELKATLNLGYDYSETSGIETFPEYGAANFQRGGKYLTYDEVRRNTLADFYLNYKKEFELFMNKVDFTVGYSYQKFHFSKIDIDKNFTQTETLNVSNSANERFLIGFFGRANLNFIDNKHLLTFTLRHDGSSRFNKENRWGWFPSVAYAWNMIDEKFMEDSNIFSNLKLRLGYGITGQENIGAPYPYLATYTSSDEQAYYQFGNDFIQTIRANAYDKDIKWEEQTTFNAGMDYGFFDNRINGSLDVYKKETLDLILVDVPIALGSNLNNVLTTNIGSMENTGLEFSINANIIEKDDLNWEAGYNITYNKNKIKKISLVDDPNLIGLLTGGISGGVGNNIQINSIGHPANTFYVYSQVYDTNGVPIEGLYEDINGDGITNEKDLRKYKRSKPNVFMGFNTRANYKNWDISTSLRASLNNYVYNNVNSNLGVYTGLVGTNSVLHNISRDALKTNFTNQQYFSDYYIRNASFLRMDYVTLGYTFKELLGKENLNLRLYSTIQNVFVATEYEGLDPEIENGIDNNFYPRPRTFLFGVNLNF